MPHSRPVTFPNAGPLRDPLSRAERDWTPRVVRRMIASGRPGPITITSARGYPPPRVRARAREEMVGVPAPRFNERSRAAGLSPMVWLITPRTAGPRRLPGSSRTPSRDPARPRAPSSTPGEHRGHDSAAGRSAAGPPFPSSRARELKPQEGALVRLDCGDVWFRSLHRPCLSSWSNTSRGKTCSMRQRAGILGRV